MDSPPPSRRSEPRSRTKSASRLSHISDDLPANLALNLTPSPKRPESSPLQLAYNSPKQSIQLQELLLLSPSPLRRSKHRERIDPVEELMDVVGSRRRCRAKSLAAALAGCASPRNSRRVRRRTEQEIGEERDLGLGEENVKVRKPRRSRREKVASLASLPSPIASPGSGIEYSPKLDSFGKVVTELVMWKDVAKSTLWFGFGSLFFLSSSLTGSCAFSIVSAISQMCLLFLAMSFFYNSVSQRNRDEHQKKEFRVKEEDIVRVARLILPPINAAINKAKELFSGEPATTMKIAPILFFASEYGNYFTIWRILFIAFFVSFTLPKLFSCYSQQIQKQVESLRCRIRDAWSASSHKKIVAVSIATVFWNLSSMKTRLFAAFVAVVIVRYNRQQAVVPEVQEEGEEKGAGQLTMAVPCEGLPEDQQLAIVLADARPATSEK